LGHDPLRRSSQRLAHGRCQARIRLGSQRIGTDVLPFARGHQFLPGDSGSVENAAPTLGNGNLGLVLRFVPQALYSAFGRPM
jgi:hypothetical protein